MNCPYCAEHINDGAVLCKSCGRDWIVSQHVMARNAELSRLVERTELELHRAQRLFRDRWWWHVLAAITLLKLSTDAAVFLNSIGLTLFPEEHVLHGLSNYAYLPIAMGLGAFLTSRGMAYHYLFAPLALFLVNSAVLLAVYAAMPHVAFPLSDFVPRLWFEPATADEDVLTNSLFYLFGVFLAETGGLVAGHLVATAFGVGGLRRWDRLIGATSPPDRLRKWLEILGAVAAALLSIYAQVTASK